jgi:hypothetical protein
MLEYITNDLFRVVDGGRFSTTIMFTWQQLFAVKNIIGDRIKNEKYKQ